ncbi:MAG: amino acid adenylation domain-containing protein [Coriobacteriales bacterium]|nr:amino acid adenylation domain-containing protein [Coriobacteriales bacterium]
MTEREFNQLLSIHNTAVPVPARPAYRLLQDSAQAHPQRTALVAADRTLTYGQLNAEANAIGHALVELGAAPNTMVAVLAERDSWAYVMREGVLKAGAAFLPIDPDYPEERVRYILEDSGCRLLLATQAVLDRRADLFAQLADLDLAVVEARKAVFAHDVANLDVPVDPHDLAYVIYTSGSTGRPKGVMIENHNLVNFVNDNEKSLEVRSFTRYGTTSLALAALTFDVSIEEEFIPLANGMTVVLVTGEQIMGPVALANLMRENRAEVLTCTPSYLSNMLEVPVFAKAASQLRSILVGAEAFPADLYTRLRTLNPKLNIVNSYGPTECTVASTATVIDDTADITIGAPLANYHAITVDEAGNPLPLGEQGELTILGEGVGRGYIGRPDLNERSFVTLFGMPAYRTGDLAVVRPSDGKIEFHGRMDDQVKLRGLRVELGEIEKIVGGFTGVRQAVVAVVKDAQEYLAAYYVADGDVDVTALKRHAKKYLTSYMVPQSFTRLDEFPLTANGKVDKRALPEPELDYRDIVPAQTKTQEELLAIVQAILRTDRVGVTTDLFEAGLSSLGAIRLCSEIREKFDVVIKTSELVEHPTIQQIETLLSAAEAAATYELRETYPLSQTQQGIYFECARHPGSTMYNLPMLYKLDESVDVARLRDAVQAMVAAHPYLCMTVVKDEHGNLCARRQDDRSFEVEVVSCEALPAQDELVRPFDLDSGELLCRAKILQTPDANYLYLDAHHIVSDGASIDIMVAQIDDVYQGGPLDRETYTGYEFALDEEQARASKRLAKARAFYDGIFAGCGGESLPPRDGAKDAGHVAFRRSVGNADGAAVRAFCEEHDLTLNAFFTAAFAYALKAYTNAEKPVFTTIYNGRSDPRLASSVSMLVKTLPVSLVCDPGDYVVSLVEECKSYLVSAMTNDIFSFAEIRGTYDIAGDVMFAFQGEFEHDVVLGGKPAESVMLGLSRARAAFGLDLMLDGDKIVFEQEYDPSVFSPSTADCLTRLTDHVVSEFLVRDRLRDVTFVCEQDKELLLTLHDTRVEVPERPAYRLLQDSAQAHPDRVALIACDRTLTYGELNAQANAIGHALAELGAAPETKVAVLAERDSWAYVMRDGALKAGAAFMPIDPGYPEERVRYILENSGCALVLTTQAVLEARAELFEQLADLDLTVVEATSAVAEHDTSNLNVTVDPHNLAYVIYTSGSTGKPKGVMIENHNLVNLAHDDKYNLETQVLVRYGHVTLALAALTFDVSVVEEFAPLANGQTVVLATQDQIMDAAAMAELMVANDVTAFTCTPSYLSNMIEVPVFAQAMKQIRAVDVGAEAFPADLYTKLRAISPTMAIMNSYGPTECTVTCTAIFLDGADDVTIGYPLTNVRTIVVDAEGRPLPVGALGELTILGDGVGRGYIGRDDLNARNFVRIFNLPAYRTGDLAVVRWDGQIEFHGRADNLVKLRGLRVELGEIENVLNSYPGVRTSVVIVAHGQTDYLAAYFTADKPVDLGELKAHLSEYLTAYMVPQALMQLAEMPLTANGKADKRALPTIELAAADIVAPQNEAQKQLLSLACQVIGHERVGITTDLFAAGLSSIGCIRLCALIADELGKTLKVADMFDLRTVEAIEAHLSLAASEEAYELRGEYPLSQTQQGIFFECLLHPDTTIYNIPELYQLDDAVDMERLRVALQAALQAHPYLFATIRRDEEGHARAVRHEPQPVDIALDDVLPEPVQLVRPFNLESGEPLFRVALYNTSEGKYLFLDTHHIVSDGESLDVLLRDVTAAYEGGEVAPETYTGFEFALDEQRARASKRLDDARAFFDGVLQGNGGDTIPVADGTPTDAGNAYVHAAQAGLGTAVRTFCEERGLSINAFFTTAFGVALQSFCFAEEAVFASIYNGRSDPRIVHSVSMFVKTLPILLRNDPNTPVAQAVDECQAYLLDAMAHDLFSFAEIHKVYGITSDILFAYQGEVSDAADTRICGYASKPSELGLSQAKAGMDIDVFLDGDQVLAECSYSPSRFSAYTAQGLLHAMLVVCEEFVVRDTLGEVRLTTADDEAAIRALHDSDWPVATRPAYRLLQDQAQMHSGRVALVACDRTLTYGQLNAQANAVGRALAAAGAAPDCMVAVLAERDSWAYVMRQGVLKAGGAFLPIDPEYPEERVRYILEDSGARLVVTTQSVLDARADLFAALADLDLTVVEATGAVASHEQTNLNVAVPDDALAYVIYTSGSTGRPKGVMLTNHNLVNFVDENEKNGEILGYVRYGLVSLAVAALTFDFAIMEEFVPLANGLTVVLATTEQIMDPVALSRLMIGNRVDVMSCTPSYISNMLDIPAFAEAAKRLRSIDFGAEAFPAGLYDRLKALNPYLHVMNGYGPTEATISCTMQVVDGTSSITIGIPNGNVHVATVDRAGMLQPLGATGELVILGDGVGRGYVGREDLTAHSFIELLGMPAYRSGDVCRIREDGQIEYRGRMDDQVKLRGLRIELGEIENVLNNYAGVRSSVVVVAHGQTDYLAAYFTADNEVDINALRVHLGEYLTEYMVPQAIMQLNEMPLTANGKVDKRALPEIQAEAAEIVAPQTQTQRQIHALACEVIGADPHLGITTDLFAAGLSSIGCIRLCALLADAFGTSVKVADVYANRTIEALEEFVGAAGQQETYEMREEYPLSQTQQGIFVECLRMPGSTAYNIPFLYKLDGSVDAARLRDAVQTTLLAHPYLFMTIRTNDSGEVVAVRHEAIEAHVALLDALPADLSALVRPFDLTAEEPLYRAEVYATDEGTYLFLDTHHIVSDGESLDVLLDDISAAYAGGEVAPESYTGFEFALDEQKARASERLAKAKAFYDGIFVGCGGDTLPPTDGNQEAAGIASMQVRVPRADAVRAFCEAHGLTANAFFTTAFGHALRAFTSAEDAAVFATIYNGRSDSRLSRAVTMLVKTLPARHEGKPKQTVVSAIEACQSYLLDAMANDLYSFAEISRAYDIKGTLLFAYQGDSASAEDLSLCGHAATDIDLELDQAKSGMDIDASLEGADVVLDCSYNPRQYSSYTVRGLLNMTATVCGEFVERATLGEVRLTNADDEAAIRALHDTDCPVAERPAYRLLQDQAATHPERTALVAIDRTLTYGELNAQANAVGRALAAAGAGPDAMVAVLAERDSWAYVMRQGVLKAGGAFLPVDPEYPEERVRYILEDSGCRLVLATGAVLDARAELLESLADLDLTVVEATEAVASGACDDLNVEVAAGNLAYVIYTSGSTGRPKGVMLTNHNLVNFVDDNEKNHEILGYTRRAHVCLAIAALTFDVSIMEEFVGLANGLTVVLATQEQIMDPMAMAQLMAQNHVNMMNCTPSYILNMLDMPAFESAVRGLRSIDLGAEAFPPALYDRLREVNPNLHIMNGYGPTEATISCTMQVVQGADDVTIGIPNANVHVATVDREGRLQPLGATGELVILGDGVGRGYVGRPDLNERSFIGLLGMRAYRSGDLARIREDGQIEYRGRMDDQVKLRGLRIELGEIENVLNGYPSVRMSAVVVAHGTTDYLAAYFTADEQVDLDALKAHLSEYLTSYMVPQVLIQLDEMPLTANGKVNKKALPSAEEVHVTRTVKQPVTDLQAQLLDIYKKALGIDEVGVDDSFFEVGGTSLTAAKVMMAAMVADLPLTYQDIFDALTVEGLEQVILAKRAHDEGESNAAPELAASEDERPQTGVQLALAHNTPEFVDEIRPGDVGNVLLTGGTGFLGAHVLRELLQGSECVVYCLVRGWDDMSAEDRLRANMFYYFEQDIRPYFGNRIVVVDGDITDAASLRDVFKLDFQTVFNCAASVKHFAEFSFLKSINVDGVRNLAERCLAKGVRLVHVSTVSVSGDMVGTNAKTEELTEARLELGQETESNGYVHTKYLAEKVVLEMVGEQGLDAKIMRVGNLMSRQQDGEFQVNFSTNNFMSTLKSYVAMGCFPMSEMDETDEFSPIDEVAHAIVLLAGTDRRFTVFHPYNSHDVEMGNIIRAMQDCGLDIDIVDDERFGTRLREALADDAINAYVSPLVNYSLDDDEMRYENPPTNHFTVKALYRLGFQWSITEMRYLRQAIEMMQMLGFFDL